MSTVHNRWELVEPALFAQCLDGPSAFRRAETRVLAHDVGLLRDRGHFDESALARALEVLDCRFRADSAPELIHELVLRTARRWLVADGDRWILRVEQRAPGHEILRWRGVTMLLPPSIIVAGALAATSGSRPCRVQVLTDSATPTEPVGHLHLHLGPMLPFETLFAELWYAFLNRGTLDAPGVDGIRSIRGDAVPEIGRYNGGRQPGLLWQWILELAFAARVWLCAPSVPAKLSMPSPLREFSMGRVEATHRRGGLLTLWSGNEWRLQARVQQRQVWRARRESARLRSLRLRGIPSLGSEATTQGPDSADAEIGFLADALRRCATDEDYARLFFQYLRVKVALYRSLTVDPWTTGLDHFLDVVRRDSAYTKVISDPQLLDDERLAKARAEAPLRVDPVEIHVPPSRWLKQPSRSNQGGNTWILSFVRAEKVPGDNRDGAGAASRWRRWTNKASITCRLVARRIQRRPTMLREVRGISVMDWERNGPLWLFEASFRRLLERSREVAAEHAQLDIRPLRTAFHLGEDFDHLLSGLRQIYEPFEWGLIHRGDRVGHALALGLSPPAWCEDNPWIMMRPWDRILDLGFVYWAFTTLGLSVDSGTIERMRVSARAALGSVFGETAGDPLNTALDLWRSLPRLAPRGEPGRHNESDRLVWELKDRLLGEPRVGRAALSRSFPVETQHDAPITEAVNSVLRRRIAEWQVAIEVNPSSNLLIGGFRCIFEQPVFHTDDLPITINADDPLMGIPVDLST